MHLQNIVVTQICLPTEEAQCLTGTFYCCPWTTRPTYAFSCVNNSRSAITALPQINWINRTQRENFLLPAKYHTPMATFCTKFVYLLVCDTYAQIFTFFGGWYMQHAKQPSQNVFRTMKQILKKHYRVTLRRETLVLILSNFENIKISCRRRSNSLRWKFIFEKAYICKTAKNYTHISATFRLDTVEYKTNSLYASHASSSSHKWENSLITNLRIFTVCEPLTLYRNIP